MFSGIAKCGFSEQLWRSLRVIWHPGWESVENVAFKSFSASSLHKLSKLQTGDQPDHFSRLNVQDIPSQECLRPLLSVDTRVPHADCVVLWNLSREPSQKSNQPLRLLTSRCCGAATAADGCGAFVYIQHICRSGTPRLPGCHGNWLSNMTAISRRNRRAALAPRVHSQQLNPLGLSPQIIAGGDVKTRSGCWFQWRLFFLFFLREGRWRRGWRHFR